MLQIIARVPSTQIEENIDGAIIFCPRIGSLRAGRNSAMTPALGIARL